MQSQNYTKKQATSEDVDDFINILTSLLEDQITSPDSIRAWFAGKLDINSLETAPERTDDAEQAEEGKAVVASQDKADSTEQSIDLIAEGITEQGLYALADILVELRSLTSEGPEEVMKANDELGRIIEFVFRHSRSYRQALRLYANRFDIIGGGDPDDHISQLVDGLLSDEEAAVIEE
jgi:hypothetical protein